MGQLATCTQVENLDLRFYTTYFTPDVTGQRFNLGIISKTGATVTMGESVINVDNVAGLMGVVKQWSMSRSIAALTVEIERPNMEGIAAIYVGKVKKTAKNWSIGTNKIDFKNYKGELLLHDKDDPDFLDRSQDITIHSCSINFDATLAFGPDAPPPLMMTFQPFYDCKRADDESIATFGDPTYVEGVPVAVALGMGQTMYAPFKTFKALSLGLSEKQRLGVFRYDIDETAITCALNEVGNIAVDTTIFLIDTLSEDSAIEIGDFLRFGTGGTLDYFYITGVVYSSPTAASITAVRGSINDNPQIVLNDEVFTLVKSGSVYVNRVTESATLESDDPTKVTVGDTTGATLAKDQKGVLEAIATGTAEITATVGAISSTACTVTVT